MNSPDFLKKPLFSTLLASASLLPGLASSALAQVPTPPVTRPAQRPPNVLFIMSDDLNANIGAYGHPFVKTPNIDRLAARGVRFERAYCNYPLCNPSRVSLLSGLRPDTSGVTNNDRYLRGVTYLPEYFSKHGYFSARVGKIEHGADQVERGAMPPIIKWDSQETPPGGNAPIILRDFWAAQKAGLKPAPVKPQQIVEYRAVDSPDEEQEDGKTARRVVQLMEQHRDRPWFLAAGLYRPHLPFIAPKKYFEMYPPEKIVLPKEYEPVGDRADIPPIAFTKTGEAEKLSDLEKKRTIAAYYACVSYMDAQVGVMLDGLDRLGMRDNTVVVFLSDHGFHLGEHAGRGGDQGLWRKQTLFEESKRTPLIVAAPGRVRGGAARGLVDFVDIYPTLIDLTGLPAKRELDGVSFAPLLSNPARVWKKAIFSQVERGKAMGRSVRNERFIYNEWGTPQVAELYDHQSDPREYRNLANDPKQAATLAQMRQLLQNGPNGALPLGVAPPATPLFAPGTPRFTTHFFNPEKEKTGAPAAKKESDE